MCLLEHKNKDDLFFVHCTFASGFKRFSIYKWRTCGNFKKPDSERVLGK